MKILGLSSIENIDHIVSPDDFEECTQKSSAMCIFTDFKDVNPLVIDASTRAVDAQLLMQKAHVSLKVVLTPEYRVCGVISKSDLSNQELVKRVTQGEKRDAILVSDLMQPRSSLRALDYQELIHSKVEDVVKTLQRNGLQHCLVVEHDNHEIRGIISTSDIARKLHINVDLNAAPSFADIYAALHP